MKIPKKLNREAIGEDISLIEIYKSKETGKICYKNTKNEIITLNTEENVISKSYFVDIDTNNPNTVGTVFEPDLQLNLDTLYIGANSSLWESNGVSYQTYTLSSTLSNNTEFYISNTNIDAGGNKTASIERFGDIKVKKSSGISSIFLEAGSRKIWLRSYAGNLNYLHAIGATLQFQTGDASDMIFATNLFDRIKIASTGEITFNQAYTFPTTDGTALQALVTDGVGNVSFQTISNQILQASEVYWDSVNGVNLTGRGNINTPYLTPEYALSDINNTGTFTCTTSTSAVVTAILDIDYALISVGDTISGTGIPVNTVVRSKDDGGVDAKAITLSRPTTTGASITATRVTSYMVIGSGTYVNSSSLEKDGFSFDFRNCNVINTGIVFNVTTTRTTPRIILGGFWKGISTTSKLISSDFVPCATDFIFKPLDFFSIGTGEQIKMTNASSFGNMIVDCPSFNALFGTVANLQGENCVWNGYRYGLLGGVIMGTGNFNFNGQQDCPSSIDAYQSTSSNILNINDSIVNGQLNLTNGVYAISAGIVTGTTHTIGHSNQSYASIISSNLIGTTINLAGVRGAIKLTGKTHGAVVNTHVIGSIEIDSLKGSYTGSGASEAILKGDWTEEGNPAAITSITLTGTARLTVLDTYRSYGYTTNGYTNLYVASGCNLLVEGFLNANIQSLAGTIEAKGVLNLDAYLSGIITGTLLNNNARIELFRSTVESDINFTPTIKLGNGGEYHQSAGKLICKVSDSKSGLIQKLATNSKTKLSNQAYLEVANGLAPIQILSNVGTAQDIEDYSLIDNCAVGFRIADTFTDITYGTAYAPNLLKLGAKMEDTTNIL